MDNTKNSMWPNGSPAELSGLKLPSDETSQQSSQLNHDLNLPTTYENSQYALSTGMIQSQQPLPKKRSPISNIESNFAVEAFSEIFSLPIGLCVIDPQNRCHVVFPMQFCSCYQIVPHKHYQQPSYYCISFIGRKTPLRIFEKDFNNPKTLTQRLSQHFNVQVKFFKSKKKTADLLHSFFSSKAIRQYVPFYFGWEEKNDGYWEYSLYRGTTHALHSWEEDPGFLIPISDDNFQQYSSTSSAILAAATQTVEMMQTISNCCIRGILWLYMHAAALFSLLREINFRISSGICIYSNDEHVLIALEKLLNWFYDETIQLSEDNFSFLTLLLERKDQPLVIRDATSQPANSKILAQCVQTGRIPSAAKNSNEFFDLSALPFVLSSETSTLNFSSNFLPLEIFSEDISANAYQVFANQKGYFQDYLFDFNLFVESQQNCLQKLFEDSISQIIFDTANDNSLSSDHILSLGILRGIHKIIDLYHENLHPTEAVAEDLRQLLSSEVEPALMSAFSQAVRFKDSSAAVEALFFTVAQQKIIADDFDVRNSKGSNIGAECPSGKQGIVFAGQDHVCFTTEAFRAVCKSCGYSTRTVCQKLVETKALKDNTSRNQTYLDKLPLPNQQYIYVYKFSADRFSLLQQQENDLKAPSECDITLQLGIGENHLPLIWNGKKNSHICITGSTGSGKTYFLKKLISQLPSQNVRCIVFDIAGDFSTTGKGSPSCWNSLKTEIIDWEKEKIPPMPFYPVFPGETNEMITNRIMGVLSSMLDMGVVQGPLISRTILSGLQNGKISSFFDLIPLIKEQGFSGLVLWKVENLSNRFPKETIPFNWKLDEPGVTVLNLHQGNDDATNSILMEMFLSTIRSIRMSTPQNSYSPIVLVLDECQLLDWSADSSASLIMTQGRKYGVSAWLSTQYIPGKKESDIWEEADMRVYFQPAPREATQIAKQLAKNDKLLVKRYEAILSDLERGQFIYKQNKNIQLSQPPENN